MAFADMFKHLEKFVSANNTAILTGVGVTGVVTTAYLTGTATVKAVQLVEDEFLERNTVTQSAPPLTKTEVVKLTWPVYLPAVGVGSVTIVSIIMANRLATKQATALAAAYGVSERAFTEYREKVVEKLGESKAQAVKDEVAQDRVNKNPPVKGEIIIAGTGEVLFYDMSSGRYFQSTMEEVRKAQNDVNHDILNHMSASLSSFYEKIGLSPTGYSDEVGWNTDNLLEVEFSTTFSLDDKPCITMDFAFKPKQGYGSLY